MLMLLSCLVPPLVLLAVFLPHTGAGSLSCRHLGRQAGLALLLLFVTEVLEPSLDLNKQTLQTGGRGLYFLLLFQHEDHRIGNIIYSASLELNCNLGISTF